MQTLGAAGTLWSSCMGPQPQGPGLWNDSAEPGGTSSCGEGAQSQGQACSGSGSETSAGGSRSGVDCAH